MRELKTINIFAGSSHVTLAHITCIHGQYVAFHGRYIALMFLYKRREEKKSLTYTVTRIS